jgi:hypothetical protein
VVFFEQEETEGTEKQSFQRSCGVPVEARGSVAIAREIRRGSCELGIELFEVTL